ncbi:MAG: branched-chain amino acid ABC transporter permease [Deltaproteobacteria bacterium]|nr:branched-chain amino acid ABC transporter permease [Deltaproteobacteria bacterium]
MGQLDYINHLLILLCIYLILAQSFNFAFGLGGLFNLAHIAAYALGAYCTAILSTDYDKSFFYCLGVSAVIAAFFSLLLGAIAIRLSQEYFAVGTLAFSAIVSSFLINWKSLTHGVLGIPNIPRPVIGQIDFYQNSNFLALLVGLTALIMFLFYLLFYGRFARDLKAQAENPYATMAIGKSVSSIRNDAFIISSVFASIGGSIFSYYLNYIDPSSFTLAEMVFVMSIVVLGKPGSFWGTIWATTFLVLLPEPLRFVQINASILGPMRQLLYAVILFLVVYYKRATIFPQKREV